MFKGLLIKESLRDRAVLDRLTITKEESWDIENPAEGQSPVWHVAWFEILDDQIDAMTKNLSASLADGKWFLEISNDEQMIVVFPGKIFSYQKGDAAARQEAVGYGRTLGIPVQQLDWKE